MKKYFFKLHLAAFFIFLLFLTANKPATAGWSEMDNPLSGTERGLSDIWGSSGSDVFAVSGDTIIHYDGLTWSEMESGTTNYLRGVWGSSATDVFAVGDNGTMIYYNGKTWSEMNSGTSKDLDSIWGSSQNDIFVTGNGETQGIWDYINFILHYNGNTCSEIYREEVDISRPHILYDIWGSSGSDVFAVSGGTIIHYDGLTWSEMKSSIGIVPTFRSIWGSSENDVYAVGWRRYIDTKICHYDGNTWSEMYSDGSLEGLFDVWGSSATDVFAVGFEGTILHYDGSSWSNMESGTTVHLESVWGSSGSDVFAVGWDGTILHYDGASNLPCLAKKIYGEHSKETEILRYIRNNILNQTTEGKELIKLYYQWSPVIVKAMEKDEEFKGEVKELIDGVLGLVDEEAE